MWGLHDELRKHVSAGATVRTSEIRDGIVEPLGSGEVEQKSSEISSQMLLQAQSH
jgi:hypothetical protein